MSSGGAAGTGIDLPPIQDMPVGAGDGLAGQHALDALENGVRAGGELKLQQFLHRGGAHRALHQPGFQQGLRFRGERQSAVDRGDVERLDAERVARQGDVRRTRS